MRLAGDFNVEGKMDTPQDFLLEQNVTNLVKEKTCFKCLYNPSCIDVFLTTSHQSFQNTTTVATGLSDFNKIGSYSFQNYCSKSPS